MTAGPDPIRFGVPGLKATQSRGPTLTIAGRFNGGAESVVPKVHNGWSDEASEPDGDGGKDDDPVEWDELPKPEFDLGEKGSVLTLYDSGDEGISKAQKIKQG